MYLLDWLIYMVIGYVVNVVLNVVFDSIHVLLAIQIYNLPVPASKAISPAFPVLVSFAGTVTNETTPIGPVGPGLGGFESTQYPS